MLSHKRIRLLLAVTFVAALLAVIATTLSRGQATASATQKITVLRRKDQLHLKPTAAEIASLRSQLPKEERQLENRIPPHVPIKIKIKAEKEKAFKDLDNENWAHDFELEVTNTGNKPIYQFYLLLVTDIKAAAGFRIVAPVYYGREELGTISTLATRDDIPLKPGESVILKIHPGQLEAWDYMRRKEKRPHPKRIEVKLEGLSFGDGTGYGGEGGIALPRKLPEESNRSRCTPQKNKSGPRLLEWLANARQGKPNRSSTPDLPANFLPVNFWSAGRLKAVSLMPEPEPTECCPGANCTPLINHVEHPCFNCPNQNRPTITYCSDPAGSCYAPEYDSIECFTGSGQPYLCQTIAMPECGGAPTPSSSPTPSPSPSPSPSCDPNSPHKLNNKNCRCLPVGDGTYDWFCGCEDGSAPADYTGLFASNLGCDPFKTQNDGKDCCVCIEQNHTCGSGCQWSPAYCECVDFIGSPCSAATPTPNPGSGGGGGGNVFGGGGGGGGCTEYWWVYYENWGSGWQEIWRSYAGCW